MIIDLFHNSRRNTKCTLQVIECKMLVENFEFLSKKQRKAAVENMQHFFAAQFLHKV